MLILLICEVISMANSNGKRKTPEIIEGLPETTLANTQKLLEELEKVGEQEVSQEIKDAVKENAPQKKETPIWKQYGFPDEKSFREKYPNYGKNKRKNQPRGVN